MDGSDIVENCGGADWTEVAGLLKASGMAYHAPEAHRKAFRNSAAVAFAYLDGRLAGFGRAISDGAYQAAIYDVAVAPEHRGKGLGAKIMKSLLSRLRGCSVILYASPGKEGFYSKLGFRRLRTGMALFGDPVGMAARGFTE